jgi:antitoxin HicB
MMEDFSMNKYSYPATIEPLAEKDGGGYLVSFPDLPGCIADGATPEEAFHQAEDAMIAWMKTAEEFGDAIPSPSSPSRPSRYSGQWRMRAPKSLHAALASRAKEEGVSLNTLTVSLLAEGLAKHKAN